VAAELNAYCRNPREVSQFAIKHTKPVAMTLQAANPALSSQSAEGTRYRKIPTRAALAAAGPAMPLIVFLCLILLVPLGIIVKTAFQDEEIVTALPRTTQALANWSGQDVPGEEIYVILSQELAKAKEDGTLRPLARRIGYEFERGSNVVMSSARSLPDESVASNAAELRAALLAADPAWGQRGIWNVIKANAGTYSLFYVRWALGFDVMISPEGTALKNASYDFRGIYLRTISISLIVTVLTVLIGYPIAYVVSNASGVTEKILLFLVLLPFWTSLLVRTMSWIVVLQKNGVVNDLLYRQDSYLSQRIFSIRASRRSPRWCRFSFPSPCCP